MASHFRTPEGKEAARRIGVRIRDARMARGLSQKQLAHALGVSHQAVNKYEQANVDLSIARLLALAKALGVTPTFLIGEARPARSKAHGLARADNGSVGSSAGVRPQRPRPADPG